VDTAQTLSDLQRVIYIQSNSTEISLLELLR
jgi:hypothetical protein